MSRRVTTIQPPGALENRLSESKQTGKPLSVKFGIDPTGPDVHLGHAVPMIVAQKLQQMGHTINLVIGDTTAAIGDPTGRDTSRPVISPEQVDANQRTYIEQMSPFIDTERAVVRQNSSWLANMSAKEAMDAASNVTLQSLTQRGSIRDRLKKDKPVSLNETLYAFLMGVDSAKINADVEIGGIDQLTNMEICQDVQQSYGQRREVIINTPILLGTDNSGHKMSKSKGNTIPLNSPPDEMHKQIASIPNSDGKTRFGRILSYYSSLTDITPDELKALEAGLESGSIEAQDAKNTLANIITGIVRRKKTSGRS